MSSSLATVLDTYPLASMQSGMLYQWLRGGADVRSRGYDIEQIRLSLEEHIDLSAFARAWTTVARRHVALGAQFALVPGQGPRQQFVESIVVPVAHHNWSALTPQDADSRLSAFLREDRLQGFDLGLAPLMRVNVFSLSEGRSEVVWTVHHILLDGRSFPIVLGEVFHVYAAELTAMPVQLPATLRDDYLEHLAWAADTRGEASQEFFAARLAGLMGPTPLPLSETHNRSGEVGYEAFERLLPDALTVDLYTLARDTETSMSAVVHVAWAIVLGRMLRLDDVLVGTTRRCQRAQAPHEASSVGLYMNTLPLRISLAEAKSPIFAPEGALPVARAPEGALRPDATSVADVLHQVHDALHALREHQTVSSTRVCASVPALHGAPPFETLVTFDSQQLSTSLVKNYGAGWQGRRCRLYEQPAVPLNVIFRHGESLSMTVLLDRARFRDDTGPQIGSMLVFVLEQLARGGGTRLREIEVVPPTEAERIICGWNNTAREFPAALLIHELFEARAESQPNATAVECEGACLSFRELDERANRLAHLLRAGGAGRGTFVGVCLDRGLDLVVSLISVLKAGAAYVPLDPSLPKARLKFVCDDANAVLILTQTRLAHLFDRPVLSIDAQEAQLAGAASTRPSRDTTAGDTCYAIFTSGTTGEPNGVVLSHRAVINTLDWVNRTFDVGPSDRLLFVTPPSFDLSVYDVFGVLGAGGTVVVASDTLLADPERLAAAITEQRITIWDSAPAALQRLTPFLVTHAHAPLRIVLLSGDWIPLTLPDLMRAHFSNARVVSLGGATEAAIWSNWYPIERVDPSWNSIPYGRPIQNARYHVLDEHMRVVPVGSTGDLYIGGDCLAKGYLNRPTLTQARFVDDPFRNDGSKLYRTGDLARYFSDGNLEFLGRSDFQVKIRGVRVELGEIEAALLDLPEVRDAVCSAQLDASGERSLIAYVLRARDAMIDEAQIKTRLGVRLPRLLVPAKVVFLEALPLSANGKVDRKALPQMPSDELDASTRIAPRNATERALVELWETLLGRRGVGVSDDFFALGGHSLLVLALVSRAKAQLDLDMSIPRFLEEPTIEGTLRRSKWTASCQKLSDRVTSFGGGGAHAPILVVAGEPAYFSLYRELANCLSFDRDVLLCEEVPGDEAAYSVEELATTYVKQLSLAQHAASTLLVVGVGVGASVAFAVANLLQHSGIRVPLLTLVQPVAEAGVLPIRGSEYGLRPGSTSSGLSGQLALLGYRVRSRLRSALSRRRNYRREGVLSSDLLLVTAPEDRGSDSVDSSTGALTDWKPFVTGDVSVLTVKGDHMTFLANGESERIRSHISVHLNESAIHAR